MTAKVLIQQKGFPLETTLDDVKEWLSDKGTFENIYLRKGPQKTFKVRAEQSLSELKRCSLGLKKKVEKFKAPKVLNATLNAKATPIFMLLYRHHLLD